MRPASQFKFETPGLGIRQDDFEILSVRWTKKRIRITGLVITKIRICVTNAQMLNYVIL